MKKRVTPGTIISFLLKILLIVIFIFPFYWMIITGFKTYQESIAFPPSLWPREIQWSNFAEVFASGPYPTYFKNSVVISVATLLLQFVVMVPASYAFAKMEFKGREFLFGIVLVAFMVPGQVTFISVFNMMSKAGWLQTLLPQIIPHAANAFGIFLLRQSMKQVPDELLESARLDNANEFQVLKDVMMPMCMPTIVSIMMLGFISSWNDYFWPFIMSSTPKTYPLTLGVAALKDAEGGHKWQLIMAGNVVLVAPIIVVYALFHKRIVRAFAYSGIK